MRFITFLSIFFVLYFQGLSATPEPPLIIPKKIVVVGAGLAGVGKSTLLKALNKKIENSIYLDKDVINKSLLQGRPYFSDYYNTYVHKQSYQLLFDLAKASLLSTNRVVILDGYFGNKLNKEPFLSFIRSSEFEVKVLYFTCSAQENLKRIIKRGEVRDQEKIDSFASFYNEHHTAHLEVMSTTPHLEIHTEENFEDNLNLIVNYLKEHSY